MPAILPFWSIWSSQEAPPVRKKTTTNEPRMRVIDTPERMGRMRSCLFFLRTARLLMAIVQPLLRREGRDIGFTFYWVVQAFNIGIFPGFYNIQGFSLMKRIRNMRGS